jgi:ABC-2 type transport system ATP-binding protein
MKQRLGIAQALLNSPKLLICDEPTSALDPIGRKEILDILKQVRGETTVIFSTHILSDVERICDHIAVIDKGKIALESAMSDLKYQHKSKTIMLEFEDEVDLSEVLRALKESDFTPVSIEAAEISIENLYMEVVR